VFVPNEAFLRAVVDSVSEEIAVIDGDGSIVMVNQAWRSFAIENGLEPGPPAPRAGVGTNYLAVCETCSKLGVHGGKDAHDGIRAVLGGRLPGFSMEYACGSHDRQRWFSMRATPLDFDGTLGAVIAHVDITESKQAELSARASQERLASLTAAVPGVVYQFSQRADGVWKLLYLSKGVRDLFEITSEAALRDQYALTRCILPEDRASHRESLERSARSLRPWIHEYRIRTPGGTLKWVGGHAEAQRQNDGAVLWNGILVDITERKNTEQALVHSEERFGSFMDTLPAAAFITDEDGGTLYVNRYGVDLLGLQAWVGKSPRDIFPAELAEKMIADNRRSVETGNVVAEEWIPGIDGRLRLYQTHKFRIRRDGQAPLLGGIALDITERKQMEDQVRRLAFYDQLTSLPNRRLLSDRLSQAMGASKRSGCYGALMFIDLDRFKALNDSHGHEIGDLLLTVAAERLRSCVREMDTVARFGGDEFVVMIGELDADKAESAAQAGVIAEKLRAALAETYVLRIRNEGIPETIVEYRCTASIGVVLYLGHEVSQDHVINCADRAMYLAKEAGCNSVRFHERGAH
jgi:diguanylate cyclase (GGDEF)-like protein/PAS domain S-box-containing protein